MKAAVHGYCAQRHLRLPNPAIYERRGDDHCPEFRATLTYENTKYVGEWSARKNQAEESAFQKIWDIKMQPPLRPQSRQQPLPPAIAPLPLAATPNPHVFFNPMTIGQLVIERPLLIHVTDDDRFTNSEGVAIIIMPVSVGHGPPWTPFVPDALTELKRHGRVIINATDAVLLGSVLAWLCGIRDGGAKNINIRVGLREGTTLKEFFDRNFPARVS
jgi:hypothetical protein